jgi:hypothetical protein
MQYIYQLLVTVDGGNPLGDNRDTIQKNRHILIDDSEEVGLDANSVAVSSPKWRAKS